MLFFSHDFMANSLNQSSSEATQLLAAGDYDLAINKMTREHVVSSFWQHWTQVESGLKPLNENPEISVALTNFRIIPFIHETLMVNITSQEVSKSSFRIELSNQNKQLYYDSKELSLNTLNQAIDLGNLEWTENHVNGSGQVRKIAWSKFKPIDGLVIRFFDIDLDQFVLNGVSLNHVPVAVGMQSIDDEDQCYLTNCMRFGHESMVQSIGFYNLEMSTISQFHPWVWLIAAWLTAVFLLYLKNVSRLKPYVLMTVVFAIVFMLHQYWILGLEQYIHWPLAVMLLVLFYRYRTCLIEVRGHAGYVWLVSALLAVVLFMLNRQLQFLTSLPMYALWALVQQMLLGPFISTYLYRKMNCTKLECATLVGVLFSIIHAPNHMLMFATLIGGVAWSYSWLKYQNIYANAFSHALLALLFYQVMPEMLLNSARVGVFF